MKKTIGVLCAFCMLFTQVYLPARAVGSVITVQAKDVINQTEGDGFHDTSGNGTLEFIGDNAVVFRPGEWLRYDVSSFSPGTYVLKAYAANTYVVSMQARVDGKTNISNAAIPSTGSYQTYAETILGNIYVPEGGLSLTIENNGANAATYFKYFTLEFVSEENLITSMKITASGVIPGGQGIGYYDTSGSGTLEKDLNGHICIRNGEWLAYDISVLPAGNYRLVICNANMYLPVFDISVDNKTCLTGVSIPSTGGYGIFKEKVMGNILLSGEQRTLKINNSSATASAYFDYILISKLEDIRYTNFTGNMGIENGIVPRGTDSFAVTLNNVIKSETVSTSTVLLKETAGGSIDYSVLLDNTGKVINIALAKTLDFQKEYEIVLSNLRDEDMQDLKQNVRIGFSTDGSQNTAGSARVEKSGLGNDGGKITATGRMLSSIGVGVSGRQLTFTLKAPNGETTQTLSSISGQGGLFEFKYTIPDSADSGKYTVVIGGEYVASSDEIAEDIYFYNSVMDAQIASEMSDLTTPGEVKAVFEKYVTLLGIDLAEAQSNIGDFDYVYTALTNKQFYSVEEVKNTLQSAISFETVNQAISAQKIFVALEDVDTAESLSMDKGKWDLLTLINKELICDKLFADVADDGRYADVEVFLLTLDENVNEKLQGQFSITKPGVSVASPSVYPGQTGEIVVEFDEAQNHLTKLHLDFKYDDSSKIIYENDERVSIATTAKGASSSATRSGNTISAELTFETAVSNIRNAYTLSFSVPTGASGTYPLLVSGMGGYNHQALGRD